MRIIFAGTPLNAARTLERLIGSGFDVQGVLTREDSAKGRSRVLTQSPVAEVAAAHNVEVFKSNVVSQPAIDWMKSKEPELGVIVAYGSILKKDALDVPTKGWINVHYSLLPEYPGASPVQQALIDGKSSTGVTIFQLDSGIDTGPILSAATSPISPDATSGKLLEELTEIGAALLVETLAGFDERVTARRVQPVGSGHVVTRRIERARARIDFRNCAEAIVNLVRAMNPDPVAWFDLDSISVRVLEAAKSSTTDLGIGEAKLVGGELTVGCLDGSVLLKTVQPAGKNQMSGADWFRGLRQESLLLS